MTKSFPLVAATAQTLLVGNYHIKKITVTSATPGVFSFYDTANTTLTRNIPAYTGRTIGTGTVTINEENCCGDTTEFTLVGRTEAVGSVAAVANRALSPIAVTAEGCCCSVGDLLTALGLTVVGTVNATAIVEYAPNIE